MMFKQSKTAGTLGIPMQKCNLVELPTQE